jgi:hypothetical protein
MELRVTSGESYQTVFHGKNLIYVNTVNFTIQYNTQDLIPVNPLNGKELTIGQVQGTDFTVTSIGDGIIQGNLNKSIPVEKAWNGIICIIDFKAIKSGTTSIGFSYTQNIKI